MHIMLYCYMYLVKIIIIIKIVSYIQYKRHALRIKLLIFHNIDLNKHNVNETTYNVAIIKCLSQYKLVTLG